MKTVLFICIHNAGRSQMAEALLNHLAAERSLAVRALSAGTIAGQEVNPVAREVMAEIGIPLIRSKVEALLAGMTRPDAGNAA